MLGNAIGGCGVSVSEAGCDSPGNSPAWLLGQTPHPPPPRDFAKDRGRSQAWTFHAKYRPKIKLALMQITGLASALLPQGFGAAHDVQEPCHTLIRGLHRSARQKVAHHANWMNDQGANQACATTKFQSASAHPQELDSCHCDTALMICVYRHKVHVKHCISAQLPSCHT